MDYDPRADFYSHIAETNFRSKEWISAVEHKPSKEGWYLVIFEEFEYKIYLAKCHFDGNEWDQSVDQILYWIGE